jgi:hypothetical protein
VIGATWLDPGKEVAARLHETGNPQLCNCQISIVYDFDIDLSQTCRGSVVLSLDVFNH